MQKNGTVRSMAHPHAYSIREAILLAIDSARKPEHNLEQTTLLNDVSRRLDVRYNNPELEQAILTAWHDLFRTGYLAWGLNLANPNPPFFHLADPGRRALERLARDPGNPSGYERHLLSIAKPDPVTFSYLQEGLACYSSGLDKAAAVMIGCASEAMLLDIRSVLASKLPGNSLADATEWKLKKIIDGITKYLNNESGKFPKPLKDQYEAYWIGFVQQIRLVRNDVGHPASIEPVTPDTVHAAYLIFPELARLSHNLKEWIVNQA